MNFGLEQKTMDSFISVFEQNSKVDKAIMFGSRAKGNYRKDSDVDIAIKGQHITTDDIIKMSIAFEEKGITHKVDLINYNTIKEPALTEHIDRVGIEFYSKWKRYKVGDLVHLEYGKSLSDYRNGVGMYDVFGTNGKIGCTTKYLYDKPSVIIGRKGAYREVHYAKNPFFVIDTAFYTKNKAKDIDTTFMYYWFKNVDINAMDSGSAIPSTSRDEVYDLNINLPPIAEQKLIAEELSSFDDKIELLNRQNKTLEQLSETLFKKQFVNEADENWKKDTLGNLFDVGIGRTPPRNEYHWFSENPKDIKWVSIRDMGNDGVYIYNVAEYLTQQAVTKFSIPIIPTNTVLLSFKLTVGRVAITTSEMLSNEAIAHFRLKPDTKFYPEFLYLFLKSFHFESLGSTSSIADAVNSNSIKEIQMPIPEVNILANFKEQIEPYFQKIKFNKYQILTLTRMRDALLPRLMRGEVKITS